MFSFRRPLHPHDIVVFSRRISQNGPRRHLSRSVPRLYPAPTQNIKSEAVVDSKGKQREVPSSLTDEVADKVVAEDQLPFLSRPLGVREKPSTIHMTWREEMTDQDVRMKHRKALVKESTKGYFTDLNATARKHGGKTWIAPRVLIREDKALYFPDVVGTDLNSLKVHTTDLLKRKVTVLSILSSRISEIQTKMFTDPTNKAYSNSPRYQFVRINLQENPLKSMLVSLFTSSIRTTIPQKQWGQYLVSSQNLDYVREDLGNTNKHVAYVFLIDENCKIRWAGCADPKPEEIEALQSCTGVLLKRGTS